MMALAIAFGAFGAHALKAIDEYKKADELMSSFLKYTVDTEKFKKNLNFPF